MEELTQGNSMIMLSVVVVYILIRMVISNTMVNGLIISLKGRVLLPGKVAPKSMKDIFAKA